MKDIEKTKKDQKGSIKPYKSIMLFSFHLLYNYYAITLPYNHLAKDSGAGLWLIFTVCLNILW